MVMQQILVTVCSCDRCRLSKRVASCRLLDDKVKAALSYSEDSDDSLVGEHSPFVKHTRSRRYVCCSH